MSKKNTMAKTKKYEDHPLWQWMKLRGYSSVEYLCLSVFKKNISRKKPFRATVYKILYGQEVHPKKVAELIGKMERRKMFPNAEEAESLRVRILLWRAFPEYRHNLPELKIHF